MINNLIHKPLFFILSVFAVVLLSLCTWSLLHGGKPFVGGVYNSRPMKGTRNFNGGMKMKFSGEDPMGSGGIGHMKSTENMTDTATANPSIQQ